MMSSPGNVPQTIIRNADRLSLILNKSIEYRYRNDNVSSDIARSVDSGDLQATRQADNRGDSDFQLVETLLSGGHSPEESYERFLGLLELLPRLPSARVEVATTTLHTLMTTLATFRPHAARSLRSHYRSPNPQMRKAAISLLSEEAIAQDDLDLLADQLDNNVRLAILQRLRTACIDTTVAVEQRKSWCRSYVECLVSGASSRDQSKARTEYRYQIRKLSEIGTSLIEVDWVLTNWLESAHDGSLRLQWTAVAAGLGRPIREMVQAMLRTERDSGRKKQLYALLAQLARRDERAFKILQAECNQHFESSGSRLSDFGHALFNLAKDIKYERGVGAHREVVEMFLQNVALQMQQRGDERADELLRDVKQTGDLQAALQRAINNAIDTTDLNLIRREPKAFAEKLDALVSDEDLQPSELLAVITLLPKVPGLQHAEQTPHMLWQFANSPDAEVALAALETMTSLKLRAPDNETTRDEIWALMSHQDLRIQAIAREGYDSLFPEHATLGRD